MEIDNKRVLLSVYLHLTTKRIRQTFDKHTVNLFLTCTPPCKQGRVPVPTGVVVVSIHLTLWRDC